MSEFLVVSSAFASEPVLAILLVLGVILALGALLGKLSAMAFGEPSDGLEPVRASYVPVILHLALVLMAGVYIPDTVAAWFMHVARMLG